MTNPPRLHTIPRKLNTVSGNKDTEMEDFPMGSTCGKILTYIRGAKSRLVWNDAANTPLTSFFCWSLFMWQRPHRQWGASSDREFWAKLLHFMRSRPCPKPNICFSGMFLHSLQINHAGRDDLAGGQISSEARISPQTSFHPNSRFLIRDDSWLLLSAINNQDFLSCFWIITKIVVI